MKYLRLYESFDEVEIDEICRIHWIYDYTINPDGSIDVNKSVELSYYGLTKIPIQFNKVNDDFFCSYNNIKTFEGAPKEVNGVFCCDYNQLTSFKYAPKRINEDFSCISNNIITFEYFPSYVGGHFNCFGNPIFQVWNLFVDLTKIELLNDYDIFRDEDTKEPGIVMARLNDFLLEIGKEPVKNINQYWYKNI